MKNHIENRLRQVDRLTHNNDYCIYESLLEIHGLFADLHAGEHINPFCLDNLRSEIKGINGKPSDCPLIEIPPHGRLIDADELKTKHHRTDDCYETEYVEMEDIDNAPTVIEAEE